MGFEKLIVLLVLFVGVVVAVVAITKGQRRIPTQSAKHVRGRRVFGGTRQFLPLRVNQAGVMPVIFASSLLLIPMFGLKFLGDSLRLRFGGLLEASFDRQGYIYILCYIAADLFLLLFLDGHPVQSQGHCQESQGLWQLHSRVSPRQANRRLPGKSADASDVRGRGVPRGRRHHSELDYQHHGRGPAVAAFYGGTGLLIVVSVALDLVKKINSHLVMRNYPGLTDDYSAPSPKCRQPPAQGITPCDSSSSDPPAAAKARKPRLLNKRLGLAVIGTGDILRDAVRLQSPLGQQVKAYLHSGRLAPDELVNEIVSDLFRRPDHPTCFVIDGYPRTLPQAVSFEKTLKQAGLDLDSGPVQGPGQRVGAAPRRAPCCRVPGRRLRGDRGHALAVYQSSIAPLVEHYRARDSSRNRCDRGCRNGLQGDCPPVRWLNGIPVLRKFFQNRPELKSPRELGLMREAGKLVAAAHRIARELVRPGVETIEIDRAIEDLYRQHNAQPLFKGYPGPKVPFPAVTCISVNEQVVHGIPGRRVLREGDIVKLDTACKLNGWCTTPR